MKEIEFVKEQIKIGQKIHYKNRVWWAEVGPYYCKPVFPLKRIENNSVKPKLSRCFLGFSYVLLSEKHANSKWAVMALPYDDLKKFTLENLPSQKRRAVRKGIKFLTIKKIEEIEPLINDLKEINKTQALRTKHGKPPSYYDKNFEKWKRMMLNLFKLKSREWWGAFYKDKLVAYIYAYEVEGVMFISASKSHTNFLPYRPNDVLIFEFLNYCKKQNLDLVIWGDWSYDRPSLNKFKMLFGFKKMEFPVYKWINPILEPLLLWKNLKIEK